MARLRLLSETQGPAAPQEVKVAERRNRRWWRRRDHWGRRHDRRPCNDRFHDGRLHLLGLGLGVGWLHSLPLHASQLFGQRLQLVLLPRDVSFEPRHARAKAQDERNADQDQYPEQKHRTLAFLCGYQSPGL